ncbi:MAG: hypothetical protein AUJ48_02765 [Deltaproteobacteria bacterium CG1_02_45_11]|nr:MAG: hypothetical protein AUJ48_02765 [Deltaproteobacteria bacterium CG1_02_45_11]
MNSSLIDFQKKFLAALSGEILDDVPIVRLTRIFPSGLAKILFLKVYSYWMFFSERNALGAPGLTGFI